MSVVNDGRRVFLFLWLNPLHTFYCQLPIRAGADPGEVKWVNFHPPLFFLSPLPSFFFLSLKYRLVLLHYYKNSPPISKFWIRACRGLFVDNNINGNNQKNTQKNMQLVRSVALCLFFFCCWENQSWQTCDKTTWVTFSRDPGDSFSRGYKKKKEAWKGM